MTVYYFSGSGRSREVAEYFAEFSVTGAIEIEKGEIPKENETAVVVFPVYCQNIPKAVKEFLMILDAKNVALVAVYGGISHGNVLHEAQRLVTGRVIGGAYIPTSHTYLGGNAEFDKAALAPFFSRLNDPKKAVIPKMKKNIFASFLPALRSRIGVRLFVTDACDKCGICTKFCPAGAIENGKAGNKCIRCLRCVYECPRSAISFKLGKMMKKYLSVRKKTNVELYL